MTPNKVEEAARAYETAMARALEAKAVLLDRIAAYAEAGHTKTDLARWAGISRPTLDQWIGK